MRFSSKRFEKLSTVISFILLIRDLVIKKYFADMQSITIGIKIKIQKPTKRMEIFLSILSVPSETPTIKCVNFN